MNFDIPGNLTRCSSFYENMNSELRNSILRRLPEDERARFLAKAEFVHIDLRDKIAEPNVPIETVDFPETGMHSIVALVDNLEVEIATVGFEGFTGVQVLLRTGITTGRIFAQSPGNGYRISSSDFLALCASCPTLYDLCLRYTVFLFDQAGQNSGCNRIHTIEERCAKWLLFCHDRFEGDKFNLTQEFLAQMLGVRRQSVNLAAGVLQQAGFIKYSRGDVTMLNREGLEGVACVCYGSIRTSLDRFLRFSPAPDTCTQS